MAVPFAGIRFAWAGNGMVTPLGLGLVVEDKPNSRIDYEFIMHIEMSLYCTYMNMYMCRCTELFSCNHTICSTNPIETSNVSSSRYISNKENQRLGEVLADITTFNRKPLLITVIPDHHRYIIVHKLCSPNFSHHPLQTIETSIL